MAIAKSSTLRIYMRAAPAAAAPMGLDENAPKSEPSNLNGMLRALASMAQDVVRLRVVTSSTASAVRPRRDMLMNTILMSRSFLSSRCRGRGRGRGRRRAIMLTAMRAVSGTSMLPMMGKRASFRIRLLFARSSQECERKQ